MTNREIIKKSINKAIEDYGESSEGTKTLIKENLKFLQKGGALNARDFINGSIDATKQFGDFLILLDKADIKYKTIGKKNNKLNVHKIR